MSKDCTKRNLVYQTYCMTCRERDEAQIRLEVGEDEKKAREQITRMKLYKYIGETSRSSI